MMSFLSVFTIPVQSTVAHQANCRNSPLVLPGLMFTYVTASSHTQVLLYLFVLNRPRGIFRMKNTLNYKQIHRELIPLLYKWGCAMRILKKHPLLFSFGFLITTLHHSPLSILFLIDVSFVLLLECSALCIRETLWFPFMRNSQTFPIGILAAPLHGTSL